MRTLRSERGEEQAVAARRTESADAREIDALLGPPDESVFGRVNVIHLLERANLAVTLAGEGGEVVGHASFLDHPIGGLVDPAHWEPYMQEHFQAGTLTPLNTLFLHLFVAQPGFAPDSVREILRAVFHAVPELHFICLLSPHLHPLDPVLEEVFEPLQTHPDAPPCVALISHRHHYCPRLHVRQGREEDHDGLLHIVSEQSAELGEILGGYSLATLLEKQDPQHQTAVCEDAHHLGSRQLEPPARWERVPRSAEQTVPHVDLPQNITRGVYGYRESGGAAVGFMSVSTDVELEVLDQSFDLGAFGGLYRPSPDPHPAPPPDSPTEPAADQGGAVEDGGGEVGQQGAPEASSQQPNVFCVQMFVMDKEHETRWGSGRGHAGQRTDGEAVRSLCLDPKRLVNVLTAATTYPEEQPPHQSERPPAPGPGALLTGPGGRRPTRRRRRRRRLALCCARTLINAVTVAVEPGPPLGPSLPSCR
ncbi:unnamed protein product [Boreogadus saida]